MKDNKEAAIERYMKDSKSKAESLYRKGYQDAQKDTYKKTYDKVYEKGMTDAWEIARFLEGASDHYLSDLFADAPFTLDYWGDVITNCDPQDVKAIMEKRVEDIGKSFKVGDVVEDENGLTGFITNADTHYHILYKNGKTWKAPKSHKFKKVGENYKIKIEY